MAGYIGAKVGTVTANAADIKGDISSTDTSPDLTLKNTTQEDTDGGRESTVTFKGEQSGGEESTLAQIEANHHGSSDDEQGQLVFKTNDGSDGASPTERMKIDSAGAVTFTSDDTSDQFVIQNNDTGSGSAPDMVLYRNSASPADGDTIGRVDYRGEDDGGTARDYVTLYSKISDASTGTPAGSFHIQTRNGTNQTDRLVVDGIGNVGIGTSSPTVPLTVFSSAAADSARFTDNTNSELFVKHATGNLLTIATGSTSQPMAFGQGSTERMRIDSSGRVIVNSTSSSDPATNNAVNAIRLAADTGRVSASADGTLALNLNRKSNDGDIAVFRKDASVMGSIGSITSGLYVADTATGLRFDSAGTDNILPCSQTGGLRDNIIDLGVASGRFDDIFATNTSIQTSDENEKQDIASLTSAEISAATAISKLFKSYKWKDKVEAKGDAARTHTGVVAQQVQTAMSDAGLDANKYAFWCSDTWWETETKVAAVKADEEKGIEAQDAYTRTDHYYIKDEAPEGATERTRLGIRYAELLAFIGAATEQRLTSIEARLDALEG
tara:strand:- start:126 stop:1787 length:1662 start_codon:yes stop_codon:yes gene_type:complete